MLWEKESEHFNAVYVDVFAQTDGYKYLNKVYNAETKSNNPNAVAIKSDAISFAMREKGNEHFNHGRLNEAMHLYNDSLRFGENGSDSISFAYANRSACFFKMKMYNECIADIELARTNGRCPANLIRKLDQREAKCLENIENAVQPQRYGPNLDFEPNERFPCISNQLKIEKDDNGVPVMVATQDIGVGETIVGEEVFVGYPYCRYGWRCNICQRYNVNLVPCEKCTVAMFCACR